MAIILSEDSAKITEREIVIPKKAKEAFKGMMRLYGDYVNKAEGGRVLKRVASDKKFDSKDVDGNGNEKSDNKISVNNAKVILHRQGKFSPNSIQYNLYGGQLLKDILSQGIRQAREVGKVKAVEPPKPSAVPKANVDKPQSVDKPSAKVKLKESIDYFYDKYLCEYGIPYVINSFLNGGTETQSWGVLINPTMYKKALLGFMKYGKITSFPKEKIYQWVGILMKNTSILLANTELMGHSSGLDIDEVVESLNSYDNSGRYFEASDVPSSDDIRVYLSEGEENEILDKLGLGRAKGRNGVNDLPKDGNGTERYNRDFFTDELNKAAEMLNKEEEKKVYGKVYGVNDNRLYMEMDVFEYLDWIGMVDWMKLPDGSDAFSDYGLSPIVNILEDFYDDMSAEDALVLVNKTLDVWHHRGDLASAFIVGGASSLTNISEEKNGPSGVKIRINESQTASLARKIKEEIRNGKNKQRAKLKR